MSSRREARRRATTSPQTVNGIPADLALGPCIEVWADRDDPGRVLAARRNWRAARARWALENGLASDQGHLDHRHLPPELRDRAPYYREART